MIHSISKISGSHGCSSKEENLFVHGSWQLHLLWSSMVGWFLFFFFNLLFLLLKLIRYCRLIYILMFELDYSHIYDGTLSEVWTECIMPCDWHLVLIIINIILSLTLRKRVWKLGILVGGSFILNILFVLNSSSRFQKQ